MAQNIRRHLSFANVASLTALVLAMGGTGYALTILRNSVGSTQIKKDGVAKSDIRKNAVTSSKVKNRSLLAGDFATGQLPAGAPGAPGATGAQGLQGPAGVVGAVIVKRNPLPVGANLRRVLMWPARQGRSPSGAVHHSIRVRATSIF